MSFVSVVIPHLNQAAELEACLSSLDAQHLDHALYEIIVIDNGSTVPPSAVVARHPRARLLPNCCSYKPRSNFSVREAAVSDES